MTSDWALVMRFLPCIFIIPVVRFLWHFFCWFWKTHELKFEENFSWLILRCLYPRELILYARCSITIMISLFKNTGKDHKGTQIRAMKYVVWHGLIKTVSIIPYTTVSLYKWTLPKLIIETQWLSQNLTDAIDFIANPKWWFQEKSLKQINRWVISRVLPTFLSFHLMRNSHSIWIIWLSCSFECVLNLSSHSKTTQIW